NLDHHPVEGLHPLRKLKKGQVVKDVQSFKVKDEFPGGEANFYWGVWKYRGDQSRLPITQAGSGAAEKDGRLKVGKVEVLGGEPRSRKAPRLALAMAEKLNAGESITLDGKLDDAAWKDARPTEWWTTPDGSGRPGPQTRARFRYDDQFLYVGVEATDSDVWSTFTARDSNTWEQEVVELFIDADGDQKDYLELQVTPANVVFDAKFETYRSDLAKARAWDMAGFETKVFVDGTLNQRDDTDKGWFVEMKVPFAQVPGAGNPPKHGETWRVNMFRFDLPKGGRQEAAAFSPPVKPDFHTLDKFGRVRFVDAASRKAVPLSNPDVLQRPVIQLPPGRLKRPLPNGGEATEPLRMMPGSAAPSAAQSAAASAPTTPASAAAPGSHR
ncbi:MAG: carbohydrate-binding family 9-like protein, partial [Myxococcales bacterium]|nr:carbohydrate-binding family 9-like protein [Myxococcales bacterium]